MLEKPKLYSDWTCPPQSMVHGYSLEVTAKDAPSLQSAIARIAPGTSVAITFLPGEDRQSRLDAIRLVRTLGLEPIPHFSARRLKSAEEFESYLSAAVDTAGVSRCFIVAGDSALPEGPFADSSALLATGMLERCGISVVGIGGHPDGHAHMTEEQSWLVLERKCAEITRRGMTPLIVTQFSFDAEPVLDWLVTLRRRGIDAPIRLGVPGPAGIKTLMRFAARCGVSASTSVLAKYGLSVGKLLGSAGPDKLVDELASGLGSDHGAVRLHFYPFGGLDKTVSWIADYQRSH